MFDVLGAVHSAGRRRQRQQDSEGAPDGWCRRRCLYRGSRLRALFVKVGGFPTFSRSCRSASSRIGFDSRTFHPLVSAIREPPSGTEGAAPLATPRGPLPSNGRAWWRPGRFSSAPKPSGPPAPSSLRAPREPHRGSLPRDRDGHSPLDSSA